MKLIDARKIAEERDGALTGNEFTKSVLVIHQDGSRFEFRYATWEHIDDFWLAVYSEHNNFHVFAKPDLSYAIELCDGIVTTICSEIIQ